MISPATSAALRSRVAEARAVRLARQFARRRVPVRPVSDLAAHAGAILDNPLDNTANLTFADHLLDAHPDDPAAEAFRQFVMEGQPLASMEPHIKGSLWRGVGPHEDARVPYYEVKMITGGNNRSIHADLTPEAMSTPVYRRLHGGKWWFPLRYVERPGNQAIDAESTRPLRGGGRGRGLTSGEVAQHIYETGGVNSLLHAIIAARYFHPERTETPPSAPREGTQYRFARAVRRYAASESDLHTIFQQIHPSVWHGETRHDTLPREVAADALDDLDRPAEAQLMRTRLGPDPADRSKPMLPVYLDNGTVRPVAALRTELETHGRGGVNPALGMRQMIEPTDRDYVNAALWSSMDNADPETGGEPLDANHGIGDIHPATLAQMVADNRLFHSLHGHLIGDNTDRSGHDFWLTRNGHGAGFRDHDDEYGGMSHHLEDAAHRFGEYDLHVGDDGMIHGRSYGEHPSSHEGPMPFARAAAAVRRYAMSPEETAAETDPFYHGMLERGGDVTGWGVLADHLDEIGSPLAPVYRAIYNHMSEKGGLPPGYETGLSLDHGGHTSRWIAGPQHTLFVQHQFIPTRDGRVIVRASAEGHGAEKRSSLAGRKAGGWGVVSQPEAEAALDHLAYTPKTGVYFGRAPDGIGRTASSNPVADLRNALEVATGRPHGQPTEPTHLARQYAAYRAPAGGVVVRGLAYTGGQMIPDLKKFLPPEKLDRLKARARTRKKKVVESRAQTYQRVRRYAMDDYEDGDQPELRPGETTADGGKFEPEAEPELGEFIANQYKSDYGEAEPGVGYSTGFLLEDGRGVPMGPGERYEDHRGAIPSSAAMTRWGWSADVIRQNDECTRTPALFELMRRSGAIRIHASRGNLVAHLTKPPTGRQRRALLEHVREYEPDSVIVSHVGGREHELSNPSPHEVNAALDDAAAGDEPEQYDRKFDWDTLDGKHHTGNVVEMDNGTAIVRTANGKEEAVRMLKRAKAYQRANKMEKLRKYAASHSDLAALYKNLRENPYDDTGHLVAADALEELHPDSPIPALVRRQFDSGGERPNNLWYEPVENSWDGTFPYTARLGQHGPFNIYLGHEGDPPIPGMSQGSNQRWVVHAVSRLPGSRDFGYTFEFPHDRAHELATMFPKAGFYIHTSPDVAHDPEIQQHDAVMFGDRMDEEERRRG